MKRSKVKQVHTVLVDSGNPKLDITHPKVGILQCKKYVPHIDNLNYVNDRIIIESLQFSNSIKVHLISVYESGMSHSIEKTHNFYDKLDVILNNITPRDKIIIECWMRYTAL